LEKNDFELKKFYIKNKMIDVDTKWAPVALNGNPTIYEVSERGEVRNINTKKPLKLSDFEGCKRAALYVDKKIKSVMVHKLVAEAFLPNPENKQRTYHKDGNKSNNNVDNLTRKMPKRARKEILPKTPAEQVDITTMTLKEIEEFPDYMVSECGKIYSKLTKSFLDTSILRGGYESVRFRIKRNPANRFVHRIVAQGFVENPNNYKQVNHKDGNKRNNSYVNLEWVTQSQNQRHAVRNGLKPTKGGVEQYNLKGELVATHLSLRDAALSVGIDKAAISRCCRGAQRSCGSFIWKYGTEDESHSVSLTRTKCVEQYTLSGDFVTCFQTLKSAADEIGCDYSTIAKCCRGKRKSCGGYTWKYRDENVVNCRKNI
jgi:hypothetical protein